MKTFKIIIYYKNHKFIIHNNLKLDDGEQFTIYSKLRRRKINGDGREEWNDGEVQFEIKLLYSTYIIYLAHNVSKDFVKKGKKET